MRASDWLFSALALSACGGPTHSVTQASNTLAPAGDAAQAGPVDGISCEASEELAFHLHEHLAVYVGDDQKLIAAGIGIGPPLDVVNNFVVGGSCFSWLHTHDQTGLIHIESPVARSFTLANFFDIWGQPLSATAVGPAQGTVHAFVDGQPFTDDPRTIPLVTMGADGTYSARGAVQLDVGTPVHPFEPYTFPAGY
jgi:hypothetical protein